MVYFLGGITSGLSINFLMLAPLQLAHLETVTMRLQITSVCIGSHFFLGQSNLESLPVDLMDTARIIMVGGFLQYFRL